MSATCTCGKSFRDGEDYRDHLPCPGSELEQLRSKVVSLEARVTELLAGSTKRETERRMWKARYTALEQVFKSLVIDVPILCRLIGPEEASGDIRALVTDAYGVAKRIDLLEQDAHTNVTGLVRDFVKAVKVHLDRPKDECGPSSHALILLWFTRFNDALPPE